MITVIISSYIVTCSQWPHKTDIKCGKMEKWAGHSDLTGWWLFHRCCPCRRGISTGWGEEADIKYCGKPGMNLSNTAACWLPAAVRTWQCIGTNMDNSLVFTLISHYDTRKMDEALKLWLFQILHNFTSQSFAFCLLQTCTHMHTLAATAAGREKKCACPHPRRSASMCVYFLYCVSMLWSEKGNTFPCFCMSEEHHTRQQQGQTPPRGKASQELRVTTTEAGAVPSLTRDTAPRTQTGKAEQVWWQRPGSATAHNHQRGPRVTGQVWGLARRANQQVRTSEGCGWAVEELQRSSRDKMQRLGLNTPPKKKGGMPATKLLMAFYSSDMAVFRATWSKAEAAPQQSWPWAQAAPHPCVQGSSTGCCAPRPWNTIES